MLANSNVNDQRPAGDFYGFTQIRKFTINSALLRSAVERLACIKQILLEARVHHLKTLRRVVSELMQTVVHKLHTKACMRLYDCALT